MWPKNNRLLLKLTRSDEHSKVIDYFPTPCFACVCSIVPDYHVCASDCGHTCVIGGGQRSAIFPAGWFSLRQIMYRLLSKKNVSWSIFFFGCCCCLYFRLPDAISVPTWLNSRWTNSSSRVVTNAGWTASMRFLPNWGISMKLTKSWRTDRGSSPNTTSRYIIRPHPETRFFLPVTVNVPNILNRDFFVFF